MKICHNIIPFAGLYQIKFPGSSDFRGSFQRLFSLDDLLEYGWDGPIKQINYTKTSVVGTVRGLHFQRAPYAEKKIIYCMEGRVCDVVVDLRRESPTYLHHCMLELSSSDEFGLLVPEGYAHGFQALTKNVQMLYFHSENYQPKFEDGISPLDTALAIDWPLDVVNLSDRDRSHIEINKKNLYLSSFLGG